ncbi:hypothetical protein ACJX0J_027924, partial [Zea mays]
HALVVAYSDNELMIGPHPTLVYLQNFHPNREFLIQIPATHKKVRAFSMTGIIGLVCLLWFLAYYRAVVPPDFCKKNNCPITYFQIFSALGLQSNNRAF